MEQLKVIKDYDSFCKWIKNKLENSEIKNCYELTTFEYLDRLKENGVDNKQIKILLEFMHRYLGDFTNNPNKAEVERYRNYNRTIYNHIII